MSNKVVVNGVDMIELIERDTPKKPIEIEDNHFNCPHCNETVSIGNCLEYNNTFHKYCANCGQRIDWKNIKELEK